MRKLLLNRHEIDKLESRVNERGYTLIPLSLYFKDGRAKVEIALAEARRPTTSGTRSPPSRPTARSSRPSAAGSRAWIEPSRHRARRGDARLLAGPRPPRTLRRARALPAARTSRRAVWEQFDEAGPKIGREWPIRYRGSHEERVEQLRSFGVRRFSALPYAHRPGVATYLNDWARDFAADVPECLWSATFYPEPEAAAYVRAADRRRRRGVQAAHAGGGVPPRRPAARRGRSARSRTPAPRSSSTSAPARSATSSPARSTSSGCSTGTRG